MEEYLSSLSALDEAGAAGALASAGLFLEASLSFQATAFRWPSAARRGQWRAALGASRSLRLSALLLRELPPLVDAARAHRLTRPLGRAFVAEACPEALGGRSLAGLVGGEHLLVFAEGQREAARVGRALGGRGAWGETDAARAGGPVVRCEAFSTAFFANGDPDLLPGPPPRPPPSG